MPVPANLLLLCAEDSKPIKVNDDLVQALLADRKAIVTCNGQLKAIGALGLPPH